jgi:choline dehydrogenase
LTVKNRQIVLPRGKTLGGTSTIDWNIYNRGSPEDYDNWEKTFGAKGWSFKAVLPFFLKLENNTNECLLGKYPSLHAKGGPVTVTTQVNQSFPVIATYQAFKDTLGIPRGDINGPTSVSSTMVQITTKNGRRVSAFTAYIEPFLQIRPNLHVWTNSFVRKILFDRNKRAYAVRVEKDGDVSSLVVKASKEIIVSAGVINSPQLLMLSGNQFV